MTDYRGCRISRPTAKPEHRPCGNDSFDLPALPKNRFLWVGVRSNYGDVCEFVVIQIRERAGYNYTGLNGIRYGDMGKGNSRL